MNTRSATKSAVLLIVVCAVGNYYQVASAVGHPANIAVTIQSEELEQIKRINGGLEFVGYGTKQRIDNAYSSVILYQEAEAPGKPMEYKGRRYAVGILSNRLKRLVMVLETSWSKRKIRS